MLILILIDSQKGAFNFEKGSNRQNHSSSGSLHLVKKNPTPTPVKFLSPLGGGEYLPPLPLLTVIWKTLISQEGYFQCF